MIIRRARPDEAHRIFTIWEEAVQATHDFLTPEDRTFFTAIVRDQFLPHARPWVAVDADDVPQGFMEVNDGKIDALFVSGHGRGIGSLLVAHAAARNAELRVDVNEQNAGAVGFYRAMGFVVTGRSELDDAGRPYPLLHMVRVS